MKKILIVIALLSHTLMAQPSCINFTPIKTQSQFLLVTDVSGSMSGKPLEDAKTGLKTFVQQMGVNDAAALVTFSDAVRVERPMTDKKDQLLHAIDDMKAGGGTHLFDALAKAIQLSKNYKGNVAIVLLSDGQDGGSRFDAGNIESMLRYQGIIFYGIGLGQIDKKALSDIAKSTSGKLELTPDPSELSRIYEKTMETYRAAYGSKFQNTAKLLVHSMPAGRPVYLQGKQMGRTPLQIQNITPGEYEVKVQFDAGPWVCTERFSANTQGAVRASESEVDKNIAVITVPHGSAVFLDGAFQGYSFLGKAKVETKTKGFIFKKTTKTVDYSNELILENVPKGRHVLKVVPFADSEMGEAFDVFEHSFVMGNEHLVIHLDAMRSKAEVSTTEEKLKPKDRKYSIDPNSVFDDEDW